MTDTPTSGTLERLGRFMADNRAGVVLTGADALGMTVYSAGAEWGQEAPDSPMAGAASYGTGDTLEEAVEELLADAGYPRPDAIQADLDKAAGSLAHLAAHRPAAGELGDFAGVRIIYDETIPAGEIRLCPPEAEATRQKLLADLVVDLGDILSRVAP